VGAVRRVATVAPFGRWDSPLGAEEAAAGRARRAGLASDGTFLYWLESRPAEGGRTACDRARPGERPEEVSPRGADVRSRVHEYGGGAFCLVPPSGGRPPAIGYVDLGDQRVRLHRIDGPGDRDPMGPGGEALTAEAPSGERWSHGDLRATDDGSLVLAVRERLAAGGRARRAIVGLHPGEPGRVSVLVEVPDFVAAPRPDAGGHRLAWVRWAHPDMPWTSSELWVGDLVRGADGPEIGSARKLAGGAGVSVGQPTWAADGFLVFASDAGGWWQPWGWRPGTLPARLCGEPAEFHAPDWALGQSTMVPLEDGRILCRWRSLGTDRIGLLDPASGRLETVTQPAVSIGAVCAHGAGAAWLGDSPFAPASIWWCPDPSGRARRADSRRADSRRVDSPVAVARVTAAPAAPLERRDVSVGEPFSFRNRSGELVHGLFHPPLLHGVEGPEGELPPLVVRCHGGPTGSAEAGFDVVVQFLTTRGFAVADVDYGGSTGYGRAYRERLHRRWGVVDVDDCTDAAVHLAGKGLVDGRRMAIRGSSAGGLTALMALARSDCFAAAVSWYGVTDLRALAASTHDFESRYTDWLVGSLPAAGEEYDQRSPRYQVERMSGAVLLLQGTEDPIVPLDQAASMAEALRRRGARCELLTFAGEGHGFRRAETVARCLRAEHEFYLKELVGPAR